MADIQKIILPSGTTYDIKDAYAREQIASLSGAAHWLGITTSALYDGATTNPIIIDEESVTANAGAVVGYNEMEFIFNGTKWQEFGSTGSLKALAFKDTASGSYTPTGSVTQPTFTGTVGSVSVTGTPTGTVSQPTFTGTQGNVSVSGTPNGNVTIRVGEGTANYTPAGSVTVTPNITVDKTSVTSITNVGALPTCTLPELSATVANETLTLGWTSGSFDAGALPTAGTAVNVATDIKTATATASFVGTGADLQATFVGTATTSTGTFTPAGSVSQPSFTGEEMASSGNFTPAGTVSQPSFTGIEGTVTVS